jgi:hypothetical protein
MASAVDDDEEKLCDGKLESRAANRDLAATVRIVDDAAHRLPPPAR